MCFNAFDKAADLDVLDHPILNLIYYLVSCLLHYFIFTCCLPYSLLLCSLRYHLYIRFFWAHKVNDFWTQCWKQTFPTWIFSYTTKWCISFINLSKLILSGMWVEASLGILVRLFSHNTQVAREFVNHIINALLFQIPEIHILGGLSLATFWPQKFFLWKMAILCVDVHLKRELNCCS
jgi:hypothetical protein